MKRARRKAASDGAPPALRHKAGQQAGDSRYSDAARAAVQATNARVREMHRAIAGKTFDALERLPFVGGPSSLVRAAHDAIAGGVYASIHHGSGGLLAATAAIERQLPGIGDEAAGSRLGSGLLSALNAGFGDYLAATGNALAIPMALHLAGRPVPLDTEALDAAYPSAGARIALLIHGLAFDEHCWQPGKDAGVDIGRQLEEEFGHVPLYLRYNTGLPIAENGAMLAVFLESLLATWPQSVESMILIGHSMGGLIARNACEQAAVDDLLWPQKTTMLVCLGSPHLGSPVERLGQAVTTALHSTEITAPLGRIAAARSQGVQDLRFGPGANSRTPHEIAMRFIGSTLTDDVDHPLAEWLGDGLVTLGSATAHPVTGNIRSARIGGLGHMALPTDARVYKQIASWLKEATPS